MNLENTALSRIQEPLSRGANFKKLLRLHISPFVDQIEKSELIDSLKNINIVGDEFLDWMGVLKGISRPKFTISDSDLSDFINVMTPDPLGFSNTNLSKPLYFGQTEFFKFSDVEYRMVIGAYCKATGFKGTVDEYSQFFKDIFGVDVIVIFYRNSLEFVVENSNGMTIDVLLWEKLVPILFQTKNIFHQSPYSLFSLGFNNIEGSELAFDTTQKATFYFPL